MRRAKEVERDKRGMEEEEEEKEGGGGRGGGVEGGGDGGRRQEDGGEGGRREEGLKVEEGNKTRAKEAEERVEVEVEGVATRGYTRAVRVYRHGGRQRHPHLLLLPHLQDKQP